MLTKFWISRSVINGHVLSKKAFNSCYKSVNSSHKHPVLNFFRDVTEQSLQRLRKRGVQIDRQLNPLYAARLRLEQRIQEPPNHPNLRLQVWLILQFSIPRTVPV